jgi:hypothetical protein
LALKPGGAQFVGNALIVLPAVRLDYEMISGAREVDDVRADAMLAAESVAAQSAMSQYSPQPSLRDGRAAAEMARAIER